jgi:hypothetical protein
VTYTVADAYSGYVADVTYSGEARYDDYKPAAPRVIAAPAFAPVPAPAFAPLPAVGFAPRPAYPVKPAPFGVGPAPFRPAPY